MTPLLILLYVKLIAVQQFQLIFTPLSNFNLVWNKFLNDASQEKTGCTKNMIDTSN